MTGSVERVTTFLTARGLDVQIRSFDVSTKNSALAAQALGCSIGEIAKSVVFTAARETFVVILSGDKRVDSQKLSDLAGSRVDLATPEVVRATTGYPIGGVPPFPHSTGVRVIPDSSLMRFKWVWAAAGAPNMVFRIASQDLVDALGAEPADVSRIESS
jgi:prolyl-tRNA editing enzyme YbaK/EbsC (Cys-tRNA(Pro) deacylase)